MAAERRDGVPDDDPVTRWALAAGRGDPAATTRFVRHTEDVVRRFLAHLNGQADVDDLVQETYLRAWRNLPGFTGRSSALTWLLVIARRVAIDHVRAARVRPRTTSLEQIPGVTDWRDDACATSARSDDTVLVRRLLAELDPARREAFVLTQLLGMSYAEAAHISQCPIGTIRSRVARARDDLIAALSASDEHRHYRTAG
ncbi:sigma-70 family RNA polymerase sigma factor [Rhizomonospora bruguierae]|uniref:sigma-70 family RNA polymerase sigma factor n=1 Tax=Rhizomonospora bruguierae TaxID=1581705 RepID=UPI001BCA992D|nr:sigma-70 family RNA polymerase sigma factor [Micromonospora sp. NBRC 107566]